MKCLVTGGAGFIGSHIAAALCEEGHDVVALDNLSSGNRDNLEGIRLARSLIEGDIRDPEALRDAMNDVDWVFHQAALVSVSDSVDHPSLNHAINLTGTLHVLEAARAAGVSRVIFAASAAAYGNASEMPNRETMAPAPESPYALAKVAGEYYLRVYARLYGVRTVALRYFNVYGPRQNPSSMYSGVISRFADRLRNRQAPDIYGDGRQTRDFVFVDDVVQANLLAAKTDTVGNGETINVATGNSQSLLDVLRILERLSGYKTDPVFHDPRPGDIRHSAADIQRARQCLGFTPRYSLEQGLQALWNSFRNSPRRCADATGTPR